MTDALADELTFCPPIDLHLSFKVNLFNFCEDYGPPFGPTVDWENNFPKEATTGVGGKNFTTLSAGYPALTFFLKKV